MDLSELTLRLYLELMRDPVDGVPLIQVDEALFASELSPEKRARVLRLHEEALRRAARLAAHLNGRGDPPQSQQATASTIRPAVSRK